MQRYIIKYTLNAVSGQTRDRTRLQIEQVRDLLCGGVGRSYDLPGGIKAVRSYHDVQLQRGEPPADGTNGQDARDIAEKPAGACTADKPAGTCIAEKPAGACTADKPAGTCIADEPADVCTADKLAGTCIADEPADVCTVDEPAGADAPPGNAMRIEPAGDAPQIWHCGGTAVRGRLFSAEESPWCREGGAEEESPVSAQGKPAGKLAGSAHGSPVIPDKTYTKWLNYDTIKGNLTLRTRRPGDFIVIDRDGARQTIKAYMINEKIPQAPRDTILLLADGSEVFWIAGYRISARAYVRDETKQILQLEVLRQQNGRGTTCENT